MAESEVQRAALGACACELCDDAAADHGAWDASLRRSSFVRRPSFISFPCVET